MSVVRYLRGQRSLAMLPIATKLRRVHKRYKRRGPPRKPSQEIGAVGFTRHFDIGVPVRETLPGDRRILDITYVSNGCVSTRNIRERRSSVF